MKRNFSGKLPIDVNKIMRILIDLETSLEKVKYKKEKSLALLLVNSLLFHQKAIQYTLSTKSFLEKYAQKKISEEIKIVEKK